MARTLIHFLSVFLLIGGLNHDSRAQAPSTPRDGQGESKPSKTKLFEVPGVGGKISQGAFGEIFKALRDKSVQQEIGLLPSQLQDLLRLNKEVMQEVVPIVENFNKLPKADQEVKAEQLRKDLASYMKSAQADVDNILVPEQQQRLRQVAFQLRLQKDGSIETLASPDVVRELGLNDVQAERFRENLKKIEEQHRSKLAELEIEKERKILALFSPNQQDRLQSMIGASTRNLSKSAPVGPKAPQP